MALLGPGSPSFPAPTRPLELPAVEPVHVRAGELQAHPHESDRYEDVDQAPEWPDGTLEEEVTSHRTRGDGEQDQDRRRQHRTTSSSAQPIRSPGHNSSTTAVGAHRSRSRSTPTVIASPSSRSSIRSRARATREPRPSFPVSSFGRGPSPHGTPRVLLRQGAASGTNPTLVVVATEMGPREHAVAILAGVLVGLLAWLLVLKAFGVT
jgi:hypothetical protein